MATIPSNMPWVYNDGILDNSRRPKVVEPPQNPTYLIRFFGFGRKGEPGKARIGSLAELQNIFGDDTFDVDGPYATHSTIYQNKIGANGTVISFTRLQTPDASKPSSLRLCLDLLPCKVPLYEREIDGSYSKDTDGNKIPTGELADGHMYKFVKVPCYDSDDEYDVASGKITTGDITDPSTQENSKRYPLLDLALDFYGADGNNQAASFWSDAAKNTYSPIDDQLVSLDKAYPFRMALHSRNGKDELPTITRTSRSGAAYIDFTLKPGHVSSRTKQDLYLGNIYHDSYETKNVQGKTVYPAQFPILHIYEDNIKAVLKMIYDAEVRQRDAFSDLTGEPGDDGFNEIYRINLFGGFTSNNTPYHTYIPAKTGVTGLSLSKESKIFSEGGGDGTINNEIYEKLVSAQMQSYTDLSARETNDALHPELGIVDTGFSYDVKKDLCKILTHRKDCMVQLCTHVAGAPALTADEEANVLQMLQSYLSMYPESTFHNTSVCRGMVVCQSGKTLNVRNRIFDGRVSYGLEIVDMLSKYMGAGSGKWNVVNDPKGYPNNVPKNFKDINVDNIPYLLKSSLWSTGGVWIEPMGIDELYVPVLRSVYQHDDSVLTGIVAVIAACAVTKIAYRIHRELTGVTRLTQREVCEEMDSRILKRTAGQFANEVTVIPQSIVTEADAARGSTITTRVVLQANGMFTAMDFGIVMERNDNGSEA